MPSKLVKAPAESQRHVNHGYSVQPIRGRHMNATPNVGAIKARFQANSATRVSMGRMPAGSPAARHPVQPFDVDRRSAPTVGLVYWRPPPLGGKNELEENELMGRRKVQPSASSFGGRMVVAKITGRQCCCWAQFWRPKKIIEKQDFSVVSKYA